jgi:hypothetical protein
MDDRELKIAKALAGTYPASGWCVRDIRIFVPMPGLPIKSHASVLSSVLQKMREQGWVREMDDIKPVAWQLTEIGEETLRAAIATTKQEPRS